MFPFLAGLGIPGFPQTTGKKRNLYSWEADFELPVKAVREELMQRGILNDVSVDVMIAAIADMVGETAARLDLIGDGFSLDERMQVFNERVEQTYKRRKLELGALKAKEVEVGAGKLDRFCSECGLENSRGHKRSCSRGNGTGMPNVGEILAIVPFTAERKK